MDIIEYMSGLTPFVFDKSLLKRIAMERGVFDTNWEILCKPQLSILDKPVDGDMIQDNTVVLDEKTRDLLRADLLYEAYLSPTISSSYSKSHGNFSENTGSQSIYDADKERLYNIFTSIYKKYDDPKLEEISSNDGTLQWL